MTKFTWSWWNWNLIYDVRLMLLYPFIRTLVEAGTIIAIVGGVVSYLVVLRRSSFASHALGHVGFSGAAGAVLFGANPLFPFYGLLLFTTVSGSGIAVLGKRVSQRDVEIGTILAFMLGLGLLFISLYNGFSTEAYSILFGQVVGISPTQVLLTLVTGIPVLVLLGLLFRPILFASLDEEVAEAKGMPTMLLGLVFMLALAVTIAIAVTVIGVLLIFALTVTPGAIAVRLARRPLHAVLVSVGVAVFATWAGIFLGFYENQPTSFYIVTVIFLMYIVVRVGGWLAGLRQPATTPASPAPPLPEHPPVSTRWASSTPAASGEGGSA
jgi:zinc/manganese transport system permease protein